MMNEFTHLNDDKENTSPKSSRGQAAPSARSLKDEDRTGHQPFLLYDADEQRVKKGGRPGNDQSRQASSQSHRGEQLDQRRESSSDPSPRSPNTGTGGILKLSPQQIGILTSSPGSLPFRPATPIDEDLPTLATGLGIRTTQDLPDEGNVSGGGGSTYPSEPTSVVRGTPSHQITRDLKTAPSSSHHGTPLEPGRSSFSPIISHRSSHQNLRQRSHPVTPLKIDHVEPDGPNGTLKSPGRLDAAQPSPMLSSVPIPPLSLPTYLQLELSPNRPSPLYIHRSAGNDFPYESSKVKFERLLNFLLLPPQIEQVLCFGALACLDSWLYTFTILPLRFLRAIAVLLQWCGRSTAAEALDLWTFVYDGVGRVWRRRRESSPGMMRQMTLDSDQPSGAPGLKPGKAAPLKRSDSHETSKKRSGIRHRRTGSKPSNLLPNHKADILQGLLIISSCVVLMWFDASRMYHSIRGQAAIKLYVIYNVLEVFDRLFSALGQDVLECLFSKETLERGSDGRSKIIRPLWMFGLALVYNVIHATALFYQVVTLNVAVNSYSNALLTLLMSNQFVEIKGTVFKKFEKENLFQLTCADVVERFQLWLMLLIIALRNVVEVGGLSISLASFSESAAAPSATAMAGANASAIPLSSGGILPKAFTLVPYWTGEVIGPFLIVLGSEMLVDWLKHAYINKFNNIKPNIYGRFLDVLAKDYYTHAFADQNLTKRLGLPVIPLSCLFIRASVQTYHMFLATHVPIPMPSAATAVSFEGDAAMTSPATMKALEHIDHIFRRALGRSSFGVGTGDTTGTAALSWWGLDDVIALATMAIVFLALYLLLLAFKLILGMLLLAYARGRYMGMKERERQSTDARGRRVGGWGVVEVGEEKRRWIYEDDPDGLRDLQAREARGRARADKNEMSLDGIDRYMMAAKRIW